jgi:hypothetical protein
MAEIDSTLSTSFLENLPAFRCALAQFSFPKFLREESAFRKDYGMEASHREFF